MTHPRRLYLLLVAAIILYGLSLYSPAYTTVRQQSRENARVFECRDAADMEACLKEETAPSGEKTVSYGYEIFLTGWLGALALVFAWYGNPLLLAAIGAGFSRVYNTTLILSGIGLILALSSIVTRNFPADEGGVNDTHIVHFEYGYYLWLLSFIFVALYGYLGKKQAGLIHAAQTPKSI